MIEWDCVFALSVFHTKLFGTSFLLMCCTILSHVLGGKTRVCLDVELVGHITCLTIRDLVCTMLQKLSKCEVKAWLCCNLIILPLLRFYVKSNFGKFKRSKMAFFAILEVLNFDFSKFEQFFKSQIYKNSNFRVYHIVKRQLLMYKFCQNWFHVKLGGINLLKFHTEAEGLKFTLFKFQRA